MILDGRFSVFPYYVTLFLNICSILRESNIGLLAAIIWLGVKSNHSDEQIDYVVETPSIEEEQANISKFHADNFNMAIDTAIIKTTTFEKYNSKNAVTFFEGKCLYVRVLSCAG